MDLFTFLNSSLVINITQVVVLAVLGYFAKILFLPRQRSEGAAGLLNILVVNFTMPALVFRAIYTSPIDIHFLWLTFEALLFLLLTGFICWFVSGRLQLTAGQRGVFVLAGTFGSTGFVGHPLIQATYGASADARLIFFSELGTLIPFLTVGIVIASTYGEGRFTWNKLWEIPKFTPFLAMLLAILFHPDIVPGQISPVLSALFRLGDATIPLISFSLGLTIVPQDFLRKRLAPLFALNSIKLLIAPLLVLLIARLINLDAKVGYAKGDPALALKVSVIAAALPSFLLILAYSRQYKLDNEFASRAVAFSFVVGAVTVTGVAFLLGQS